MSATPTKDVKAVDEDDYSGDEDHQLVQSNLVKIVITYNGKEDDSNIIHARPGISFEKVLKGFAQNRGISTNKHRLLYDGDRLLDAATPRTLGWRIGRSYRVDCVQEVIGGNE